METLWKIVSGLSYNLVMFPWRPLWQLHWFKDEKPCLVEKIVMSINWLRSAVPGPALLSEQAGQGLSEPVAAEGFHFLAEVLRRRSNDGTVKRINIITLRILLLHSWLPDISIFSLRNINKYTRTFQFWTSSAYLFPVVSYFVKQFRWVTFSFQIWCT